jgi:hypothetical protein
MPWLSARVLPRAGSDDHATTTAIACLTAVLQVAAGAAAASPGVPPPAVDWEALAQGVCDTGASLMVRERLAEVLARGVAAFPAQVRSRVG